MAQVDGHYRHGTARELLLTPTGSADAVVGDQALWHGSIAIWPDGFYLGLWDAGWWDPVEYEVAFGKDLDRHEWSHRTWSGNLIVGLAPATMFWLAVFGMAFSGLMNPITNGPLVAIMQASVKPEMQGRVMGVIIGLANLMTPLGLGIAGPVSDAIGIRTWYWVSGLICLLMGVIAFFIPIIMNVESKRNGLVSNPSSRLLSRQPIDPVWVSAD